MDVMNNPQKSISGDTDIFTNFIKKRAIAYGNITVGGKMIPLKT
jgi:hypothetical protein